jgi:hypothetical protein
MLRAPCGSDTVSALIDLGTQRLQFGFARKNLQFQSALFDGTRLVKRDQQVVCSRCEQEEKHAVEKDRRKLIHVTFVQSREIDPGFDGEHPDFPEREPHNTREDCCGRQRRQNPRHGLFPHRRGQAYIPRAQTHERVEKRHRSGHKYGFGP